MHNAPDMLSEKRPGMQRGIACLPGCCIAEGRRRSHREMVEYKAMELTARLSGGFQDQTRGAARCAAAHAAIEVLTDAASGEAWHMSGLHAH